MMSLETFLLLDISIVPHSSFPLLLIIFLSTLFVYNLDLFRTNTATVNEAASDRGAWRVRHIKAIRFLNIAIALCILVLSFFSTYQSFLFFLHLALISMAYYLSFKIGPAKFTSLRSIPFLKAFIITYVWTASTVLLPALRNGFNLWNEEVLKIFSERYLFLFALAIIFDIRDMQSDNKKILTIPGAIGPLNTKLISFALLILNGFLVSIHYTEASLLIPLIISIVLTGVFIYKAKPNSGEYYFLGLLDGAMALQFIVMLIFGLV
jgi:hypothetical protein